MEIEFHRQKLYLWLRQCLIGPGAESAPVGVGAGLRGIKPLERFQTAILFPIVKDQYGIDAASEELDDDQEDGSSQTEDGGKKPAADGLSRPKRRFVPPSSVGLSFFISGDSIRLQLLPRATRYEPADLSTAAGRDDNWRPVELGRDGTDARDIVAPSSRRPLYWREAVFAGRGELVALWRPLANGWLVTASLSNTQNDVGVGDQVKQAAERNRLALFDVELECVIDAGEVGPYPGVEYGRLSPEEQELELQYRHHRIYAIGHGAAVDWVLDNGRVSAVRTEFLPQVEVPRVSADAGSTDSRVLRVEWLAKIDEGDQSAHCTVLSRFVDAYECWVGNSAALAATFGDANESAAAGRIVERMKKAVTRMRTGIALLERDSTAAKAFALANQAMAMQMRQADRVAGRSPRAPLWRPFQLAFLLLTIESAIHEDSPDRDTLDLIWFPTGGGKTEAYLGLMAFVIWRRRLGSPPSGGGTAILMRYTLRLLTKDQFRRAARLICAMELIRRWCGGLGDEPVSLGLWVGGASSPNRFADAKKAFDDAVEAGSKRPPSLLVLESCPWCGAQFELTRNYDVGAEHFRFRCTDSHCDFGAKDKDKEQGILPCNVVDAALYETPPTLLLATLDKFARLAWDERSSAFFGVSGNRPPELIIQDELHLIASALGSVAGLYEAGLETILTLRGVHPKYIASTATIRMAGEQVQRLYSREATVFPPPGLDCDDSYFARTVPTREQPGRLYLGFLAPARNRQHCLAPLAGALLAAPEALFSDATGDRDALLDAWWTLMVYHGSLKGVGVSRNALQDVEQFMERQQREEWERKTADRSEADEETESTDCPWTRRKEFIDRVAELTSHGSADDNARNFDRLQLARDESDALDMVFATNMVSVGLDVARLAAMVINGQPLTTAEYIQASSRVGRSEIPGIVIANYFRDQARSLSHYESFRAYHESFYRFVEPTSVTPFTYQARLRALHAALVIAVRHSDIGLGANERAGYFDPTASAIAKVVHELTLRCRRADPGRADDTEKHIRQLADQWGDLCQRARDQGQRLVYSGSDRDRHDLRLLYSHEARIRGLWATLNSMRNVENTSLVKIL